MINNSTYHSANSTTSVNLRSLIGDGISREQFEFFMLDSLTSYVHLLDTLTQDGYYER